MGKRARRLRQSRQSQARRTEIRSRNEHNKSTLERGELAPLIARILPNDPRGLYKGVSSENLLIEATELIKRMSDPVVSELLVDCKHLRGL